MREVVSHISLSQAKGRYRVMILNQHGTASRGTLRSFQGWCGAWVTGATWVTPTSVSDWGGKGSSAADPTEQRGGGVSQEPISLTASGAATPLPAG